MNDKRYQIFISSTFADLKEERRAAMQSVIDLRHIPIGMEGFPAVDEEQMHYITRLIDECDYYVLIVKNRYGSTDADGVSFTEREYDYAVAAKKGVLAFLNETEDLSSSDNPAKLASFRRKVSSNRVVKMWSDRSSLELAVFKSLSYAFESDPREGWVKSGSSSSTELLEEINALRKYNAVLGRQLSELSQPLALAPMNSTYRLRYIEHADRSSSSGYIHLTWNKIFYVAGSTGADYFKRDSISGALSRYIEIEYGDDHQYQPNDNDLDVIIDQLILLGLIEERAPDNYTGFGTVYCLTEKGRSEIRLANAVREHPDPLSLFDDSSSPPLA